MTVAQNQDLSCIHHCGDTYSKRTLRYVVRIAAEEAGIGYTRILGKSLYTRSGRERPSKRRNGSDERVYESSKEFLKIEEENKKWQIQLLHLQWKMVT